MNVKTNTRTCMHFVWIATDRIPCALIYLIISVCCRVRVSVCPCVFVSLNLSFIYGTSDTIMISFEFMHMKIQLHQIDGIFAFFNENSISMVFAIQSYFILICATSITILFIHCFDHVLKLVSDFRKKKFKNIRKEKCRLALIGQQCVHLCTNVETRVHSKEQRPIFIY